MEDEDQILLCELKSGHKLAYERVFKKYYGALAIKAFVMLDNKMEAEDLVQNLFISMWEKSQFDNINTSLKSYLFRATHNQCLMVIRSKKAAYLNIDRSDDQLDDDSPLSESELRDNEDQINLAFNQLPPQRQKAFKLVYLDDKKYKEAAEIMGLSVNSLKTHLKLAIKMLQQKLINLR
ncbi:MAG: sigma-70 family RNA polymerase sigma factor [Pedobacter sp.]|nr:MAG: sigma-70 family RNA polymerase sigma factor [Pedobacter sp.]